MIYTLVLSKMLAVLLVYASNLSHFLASHANIVLTNLKLHNYVFIYYFD